MTASIFSDRMHHWARQRAIRIADECHRAGHVDPAAHFDAVCRQEQLLTALRSSAEPVFMARIMELERDRG